MIGPTCERCVEQYRRNWEPGVPAMERYPDPHCSEASPWCPLYEAILIHIGESDPDVASLAAGIRARMRQRLERKRGPHDRATGEAPGAGPDEAAAEEVRRS